MFPLFQAGARHSGGGGGGGGVGGGGGKLPAGAGQQVSGPVWLAGVWLGLAGLLAAILTEIGSAD